MSACRRHGPDGQPTSNLIITLRRLKALALTLQTPKQGDGIKKKFVLIECTDVEGGCNVESKDQMSGWALLGHHLLA